MIEAIFKNIIGFDGIIILLGILNGWLFYTAYKSAEKLRDDLSRDGVCQADMRKDSEKKGTRLTDRDIISLRNKAETLYTWYINISAIFPLMGILGTVWALVGLQSDGMSSDDSFLIALTSTLWGLIFSIIFKALQTIVETKLDEGIHEAERCLKITSDEQPKEEE